MAGDALQSCFRDVDRAQSAWIRMGAPSLIGGQTADLSTAFHEPVPGSEAAGGGVSHTPASVYPVRSPHGHPFPPPPRPTSPRPCPPRCPADRAALSGPLERDSDHCVDLDSLSLAVSLHTLVTEFDPSRAATTMRAAPGSLGLVFPGALHGPLERDLEHCPLPHSL